jgi:threonine dehydratase
MQSMGAEVVVAGADFDEAREIALARAEEDRLRYVHVANTPELIAGVGTFAMEVLQELPSVEAIIVPVGSGSSLAGAVLSVRALKPTVRVIGVQASGACALALSLKAGTMKTIAKASTFADGLATRYAFELTFEIASGRVDDLVLVDEAEIADGVRLALNATHNLAEGATGAAYAGLWKLRNELKGRTVAVLHSGHNIEPAVLGSVLRGETPAAS